MVLIDTSAFIEFLNHTGSTFDREVERLIVNEEDVAIADIILTEILQGIRDDKEHEEMKTSLLSFPVYSLKDHNSYIAAAELYRKCRKKGITLRSTVDLLIAQISIENDLALMHNDKDFDDIENVSGMKVYKIS